MQTKTAIEIGSDIQAAYPESINTSKSSSIKQAILWAVIAIALFVIYNQQDEKGSTLAYIQLTLILASATMSLIKLITSNKLTYTPTGSAVEKRSYNFNITRKADILQCLEEGNTSRLKAFKNDAAGGLMVELLESCDKAFTAARLLKYEPHGYEPQTEWYIMH